MACIFGKPGLWANPAGPARSFPTSGPVWLPHGQYTQSALPDQYVWRPRAAESAPGTSESI